VHEDSVEMSSLHRSYLYGFLPPAHYLVRTDIGYREKDKERDRAVSRRDGNRVNMFKYFI
jgi:hypothetical protein